MCSVVWDGHIGLIATILQEIYCNQRIETCEMTDHCSSLLVCKAWFFWSSNRSHALLWRLSFFFFQCSTTTNIVQQENLICNSPLDCLLISHGFNPPLDSLWFLMFTPVWSWNSQCMSTLQNQNRVIVNFVMQPKAVDCPWKLWRRGRYGEMRNIRNTQKRKGKKRELEAYWRQEHCGVLLDWRTSIPNGDG